MPFTNIFSVDPNRKEEIIAGKIYEHSSLRANHPLKGSTEDYAIQHFANPFKRSNKFPKDENYDFFVSLVWGDHRMVAIDFFGYKLDDRENWHSNAGVHPWVCENGIWKRPDGGAYL